MGEIMANLGALLLTLVAGLFFLIGFLLVKFVKKKKELSILATGMALVVMLGMVFFDLIPEIIEMSSEWAMGKWEKVVYVLCFIFVGILILKIFDYFLPHHHHDHYEGEKKQSEHNHHVFHIGFITALSLILHNVLEGMSIYIIGTESLATGFMTAIAVGCHNLPLGIEVASSIDAVKKGKAVRRILLALLVFSSAFGALCLFFLQGSLPNMVMLALICIACGMILYISLFELLRELMNYLKRRETYYGMAVGVLVILLMTFIH